MWIEVAKQNTASPAGFPMTALLETITNSPDARTVPILAKSIYRELRGSGLGERDVMALAGELLSLVASDVRSQKPNEQA